MILCPPLENLLPISHILKGFWSFSVLCWSSGIVNDPWSRKMCCLNLALGVIFPSTHAHYSNPHEAADRHSLSDSIWCSPSPSLHALLLMIKTCRNSMMTSSTTWQRLLFCINILPGSWLLGPLHNFGMTGISALFWGHVLACSHIR